MEKIGRLVLSGGSSRVPGLTELLASGTGLEVEVCNPFSQVEVDEKLFDPAYLKSIGPQVAIGVGLALRKVGDR
jgi:type IV pilus assembly protein PilM